MCYRSWLDKRRTLLQGKKETLYLKKSSEKHQLAPMNPPNKSNRMPKTIVTHEFANFTKPKTNKTKGVKYATLVCWWELSCTLSMYNPSQWFTPAFFSMTKAIYLPCQFRSRCHIYRNLLLQSRCTPKCNVRTKPAKKTQENQYRHCPSCCKL